MSWPALLALGAGHGINPAMGWLFAVALGFQRRSRIAVWGALGPLAVGHAVAIVAAIALAGVVGLIVPLNLLQWITAGSLVVLGGLRLLRSRHLVYGGMNVDARELAVWSFLMASAHGAGLMVLPFVLGQVPLADHAHHQITAASVLTVGGDWDALLAALIHTGGYLLMTGLVAVIVYERIGLRFLRTGWLNLDLVWSVALVATGVATLVLK